MIIRCPAHSDSFIRRDLPTLPLGQVGEANSSSVQYYQPFEASNRTIMKFTLPPNPYKTITKVSVMVYAVSASSSGQPINCHIMNVTDWMEMGVCWNSRFPGNNWTTAGGDFTLATINGTLTDTNIAAAAPSWQEFVVYGTGAVNNITLPAWGSTVGFIIKALNGTEPTPPAGATCNMGMWSAQYEDPRLRPYLAIEVADDPHGVCVAELTRASLRPAPFFPGLAR